MYRFDGGKLFIKITGLSNAGHSVPKLSPYGIPVENYIGMKENIDFVYNELVRLGLKTAAISAKEINNILHNEVQLGQTDSRWNGEIVIFPPLAFERFRHHVTQLVDRFRDELSSKLIFCVSDKDVNYLQPCEPLFGSKVFNAFPLATVDINEAAACLAMERATACVMHLMRVIEVGLEAIAKYFDISKQNNWGQYIGRLTTLSKSSSSDVDRQYYSETATTFDNIRIAFRNPTMHVDRSYTIEHAEEIFYATRSLMRHLSKRIHDVSVDTPPQNVS